MMGAAGAGGAEKVYVEDVFSTWLYSGNGSTQTITNGIDLAGEGGMIWVKSRSYAWSWNQVDTARGRTKILFTDRTDPSYNDSDAFQSFNSNGFTVQDTGALKNNDSSHAYASWTFRKAEKFFDVVTYTGNGSNRTIAHSLGSVPGTIIVKRTNTAADWQVYHRSLANTEYLVLNSTVAKATGATRWNSTTPTSTVFSLGTDATVNASGGTYVAYLFAHDAGGFGASGNESIIKCGSYTGNSSVEGPVIDLGWEPQWLLIKNAQSSGEWNLIDGMRGLVVGGADAELNPNFASNEASGTFVSPLSTGFQLNTTDAAYNSADVNYIYIAIRRGPMKTPTDATQVFAPSVYTGTNADNRLVTTGIVTDMVWVRQRNDTTATGMVVGDRLRGQPYLRTGTTTAELADADSLDQQLAAAAERGTAFSSNIGFWVGNDISAKLNLDTSSNNHVALAFRRAPGFFDIVAYTGTGVVRTVAHNLGVVPELMIVKRRSLSGDLTVYANNDNTDYLALNTNLMPIDDGNTWNDTSPTSSVFTVGTNGTVNGSTNTYIAYLFASCPGVSKVGSYTGNGSSQTINCGFTNGARFVLIKRTDNTGDWLVADTARGIVSGNDPLLRLNSNAAEVTTLDWLDPDSSGFIVNQESTANANVNNGSYVYLAIA